MAKSLGALFSSGLILLIVCGAGIAYGYSTRNRGAQQSDRSVSALLFDSIFDIVLAAVMVAPILGAIAFVYWWTPKGVFDIRPSDLTMRDLMSAMG
jgi:hypothetical protein